MRGRYLQLVELVQSSEGPVGVLYCARDVVMVQLPAGKERRRGDKKEKGMRRGSVHRKEFPSRGSRGLPARSRCSPPICTWPEKPVCPANQALLPFKRGGQGESHASACEDTAPGVGGGGDPCIIHDGMEGTGKSTMPCQRRAVGRDGGR